MPFMEDLISDAEKKAKEYGAALASGIHNTTAGYVGALGPLDRARQISDQGAALAPQTPDLIDLLSSGKYGEAADAAGKALTASLPQMGATLAGARTGAAVGSAILPGWGTGIGAVLGGTAAAIPYFYGTNLIDQSKVEGTTDINKLDRGRAAAIATGQGALDSLVTILFPSLKVGPGAAKTIVGRMGKGAFYGAVEEAPVEALQEAGSILNEHPEFERLFDEQSLQRMKIAAQYGGAIGSPIGAGGQVFTTAPALNRVSDDVARDMQARRYFTPRALSETPEGMVVWGDPKDIADSIKLPKVDKSRSRIYNEIPSISIDEKGRVTNTNGIDAISYLGQKGATSIPIRILLPEGTKVPDKVKWGKQWVSLNLQGKKGTGSATNPIEINTDADRERARKVANKRPRHAGYIKGWGMDIAVQTPMGGLRKGTDRDGNQWATVAPFDYGEIRRTKNADGAPVDVWMGPNNLSNRAFVIEQVDPETGAFDEHKAMLGFDSEKEAIDAYDKAFGDGSGPKRRGQISEMSVPKLRAWAKDGDPTKELSKHFDEAPIVPEDIHAVADKLGVQWDNNANFMKMTERVTGKRHLDEMNQQQLRKIKDMLDSVELSGGSPDSVTDPIQVSFEATPSTKLDWHFMNNLPKGDINGAGAKWDWQRTIDKIMLDKDGNDRLAKVLGLADLFHLDSTGWWEGQTNPVTQSQLMSGLGHHVRNQPILLRRPNGEGLSINIPQLTPQARQLMSSYAAAKGLATKQDGVGWHFSVPTTEDTANGIDVEIGEPIGEKDTKRLIDALNKAGLGGENVIPVALPTGVRVFIAGAGGQHEVAHDPKWARAAAEVAKKVLKDQNPDIDYNWTESHVVNQDWTNDETGQGYANIFNQVASPSARAELGRILDEIGNLESIRTVNEEDGTAESRRTTERINRYIKSAVLKNEDGDSPINASEQAERRERFDPSASIPLGGLEVSPFGQRQVYDLFGHTDEGADTTKDLMLYDLKNGIINKPWRLSKLLDEFGFRVRYFSFEENPEKGVKWRVPDLKRDAYDNGTLWIYNPNNSHGAFDGAPDYTNAWRITHELAHALTERVVQRKYGSSKREGRLGRVSTGYRGVPGKQVEIELRPLTLKEAQRAVEWEDITFRMQRKLLERMGVKISDVDFNKEYNVNMADAVYRILSGDFGDPGKRGFRPFDQIADVSGALKLLEDAESRLAANQGRPKTKGVDLNKWRQLREDEISDLLDYGLEHRRSGRALQSEKIGLKMEGGNTNLLDGVYSPLARAIEAVQLKEGTPEQWRQNLLTTGPRQKYGIKDNELRFTKFEKWLDNQFDKNRKLTKGEVLAALMEREPQIVEVYFGTRPPPVIGQKVDESTEVEPEEKQQVLEFDESSHDDVGKIDWDSRAAQRREERERESYEQAMYDSEEDYHWEQAEPEDLWDAATNKSEAQKGYDIVNKAMPETGDYEWAAVKYNNSSQALRHLVADIPGAVEEYNRQFPERFITAGGNLRAKAKAFVNKALTDEYRRISAKGGTYTNGDFDSLYTALDGEHAADIIENDKESLRDDWRDNDRIRDRIYQGLSESFSSSGWADDLEPRIWKKTVEDAEGNDINYEIREDDIRDSGRYTTYVDDEEQDTFDDFQAAADSLQGIYSGSAAPTSDAMPVTDLPRNSVYMGKSRWGHYNISAGPPKSKNYRELVTRVLNLPGSYNHGHYDGIENPVIHVRTQDIDVNGDNSLFMRERQSDQYSAGAKSQYDGKPPVGFYDDFAEEEARAEAAEEEMNKIDKERKTLMDQVRDIKHRMAQSAVVKSATVADKIKYVFGKQGREQTYELPIFTEPLDNLDSSDRQTLILLSSNLKKAYEVDEVLPFSRAREGRRNIESYYMSIGQLVNGMLKLNIHSGLSAFGQGIYEDAKPIIARDYPEIKNLNNKIDDLDVEIEKKKETTYKTRIPASPWQKQWDEYTLRRMLMWSAERGYDSISWPTGNMLGLIEGWGSGQAVIQRDLSRRAAIRDRNDYGAVNFYSAIGKKYGVKPRLINSRTGKEVDVKLESLQYLPDGDGVIYGDDLKPVRAFQGEKDNIKQRAMRAWAKDNKLETKEDIAKYLNPGLTKANDLPMSEDELLNLSFKTAASEAKVKPFKFQMMTTGYGGTGQRDSINMLGDDYIWVFDIPDKMREDLMKDQVPGYWRGGLVRAA